MRAGLLISDVRPVLAALDDAGSVALEEAREQIVESVRIRRSAINDLARQLRGLCDQRELYGRKERSKCAVALTVDKAGLPNEILF